MGSTEVFSREDFEVGGAVDLCLEGVGVGGALEGGVHVSFSFKDKIILASRSRKYDSRRNISKHHQNCRPASLSW